MANILIDLSVFIVIFDFFNVAQFINLFWYMFNLGSDYFAVDGLLPLETILP